MSQVGSTSKAELLPAAEGLSGASSLFTLSGSTVRPEKDEGSATALTLGFERRISGLLNPTSFHAMFRTGGAGDNTNTLRFGLRSYVSKQIAIGPVVDIDQVAPSVINTYSSSIGIRLTCDLISPSEDVARNSRSKLGVQIGADLGLVTLGDAYGVRNDNPRQTIFISTSYSLSPQITTRIGFEIGSTYTRVPGSTFEYNVRKATIMNFGLGWKF